MKPLFRPASSRWFAIVNAFPSSEHQRTGSGISPEVIPDLIYPFQAPVLPMRRPPGAAFLRLLAIICNLTFCVAR